MIPLAFDETTAVKVQRTFRASRERVFQAWTEREALQKWFRPRGHDVTISELEVQVGGSFRFDFADGSESLVGTYLEIVRPETLVFTWSSVATHGTETVVTVEFIDQGPETQVVLTHALFTDKDMCSLHEAGWQWLFAHLADLLPSL